MKCDKIWKNALKFHKKMKFLLFSIDNFFWELSTYFESILFLVNCVLFNFVMEFKSSPNSIARYTKKNDHLGIWKYGWVSQHHNIFTNCGSHCFDYDPCLLCFYVRVLPLYGFHKTYIWFFIDIPGRSYCRYWYSTVLIVLLFYFYSTVLQCTAALTYNGTTA